MEQIEQKEKKKKFSIEKINLETILCMFLVACPILDMTSFLFRNAFQTAMSPSTIIRPAIPIIAILYLFIKKDRKFKLYTFLTAGIYFIYAVVHLVLFQIVKTQSSYSNVIHEAQYLMNYSFMILNLFLYAYVFRHHTTRQLRHSVLIAMAIYIISIFLAILTKTSSPTYLEENIGYKGWYESGNSVTSILILSLFVCLPFIRDVKERKIAIPVFILVGIFLATLIGTRAGLLGFIVVLILYIVVEIIMSLIHNQRINKKILVGGIVTVLIIVGIVGFVGSNTLQRRKNIEMRGNDIIDPTTQKIAPITGDLLEIKNKIENQTLETGFMKEREK